MTWTNGPITVYHGTDSVSAGSIRAGINSAHFRPHTDFGAGFYVSTVLHQAQQWANQRARRTGNTRAEVLEFELDRNAVEPLRHLTFNLDGNDYWDFVAYCRSGAPNHGPRRVQPYDIVYGPVSLWSQQLVLANCDQVLLSDPGALGADFHYRQAITPNASSRFF